MIIIYIVTSHLINSEIRWRLRWEKPIMHACGLLEYSEL